MLLSLFSRMLRFPCILLLLLLCSVMLPKAQAAESFLPVDEAFRLQHALHDQTLTLHIDIAPGYYLYQERFKFEALSPEDGTPAPSAALGDPLYTPAVNKHDPTFGKVMAVFLNQADIQLPLRTQQDFKLRVTYQGCAEAGLCYPPAHQDIMVRPRQSERSTDSAAAAEAASLHTLSSETAPRFSATSGQQSPLAAILRHPRDEASQSNGASVGGATNQERYRPGSVPAASAQTADSAPETAHLTSATASAPSTANDQNIAAQLKEASPLKVALICLGMGVLLALTPCVLPMLPILYAVIVRDQSRAETASPPARALGLALLYVLGTSLVYMLLGAGASLLGSSLSVWLQKPPVLIGFALLLTAFALSMFGVFHIQTPAALQNRLARRMEALPGGRWGSALVMGALSALICSPCVAAPLAGVLLFASQNQNILTGTLALFALAWGQGLMLLILGGASSLLIRKLGRFSQLIKHIGGILLLATALWLTSHLMPAAAAQLGWALLLLWFGRACWTAAGHPHIGACLLQAMGMMAIIWAVLIIVGTAGGTMRSPLQPLAGFTLSSAAAPSGHQELPFTVVKNSEGYEAALAAAKGQPVLVEFDADWCVACREMQTQTYADPAVRELMQQYRLIQVDVTDSTPDQRALMTQHKIFGPPAVIFYDKQGRVDAGRRAIGYMPPRDFLPILQAGLR